MSGANVAGAETWRLESEDRVIITASPGYENSVLATWNRGLVGTWLDVLPLRETAGIGDDTLTCDNVVPARPGLAGCDSNGPDAIGITEGDYSEACQHSDAGICTLGLFHESTDGFEYVLLVDSELARLLKIICEYVEQKLGIGRGVDVAVSTGVHEVEQGICVDEITVLSMNEWGVRSSTNYSSGFTHMSEHDAVR